MARKKVAKDPQDEIDAACKLLCDEAANHMKVRNYTKALSAYQKVSNLRKIQMLLSFFWALAVMRNIETGYRLLLRTVYCAIILQIHWLHSSIVLFVIVSFSRNIDVQYAFDVKFDLIAYSRLTNSRKARFISNAITPNACPLSRGKAKELILNRPVAIVEQIERCSFSNSALIELIETLGKTRFHCAIHFA